MYNPPLHLALQIKQVERHVQHGRVGAQLAQHVMALATMMRGVIEQVQQDQAFLQFQRLSGHVVIAELLRQGSIIMPVHHGAENVVLGDPSLFQRLEIVVQRGRKVIEGLGFAIPAGQPDAFGHDDMIQRCMQVSEKALTVAAAVRFTERPGHVENAGIGPAIISGEVEQVLAHGRVSNRAGPANMLQRGSVIATCHARFA